MALLPERPDGTFGLYLQDLRIQVCALHLIMPNRWQNCRSGGCRSRLQLRPRAEAAARACTPRPQQSRLPGCKRHATDVQAGSSAAADAILVTSWCACGASGFEHSWCGDWHLAASGACSCQQGPKLGSHGDRQWPQDIYNCRW